MSLASPLTLSEAIAAANGGTETGSRFNVQEGTYNRASTDTISAGGSATSPTVFRGFKLLIGDGHQGYTSNGSALVTTHMPLIIMASGTLISITGNWIVFESINIQGNRPGTILTLATDSEVKSCVVTNSNTNAATAGMQINTRCKAIDCDATLTGASGGLACFTTSTGTLGVVFQGCRAHTTSTTAAGFATSSAGSPHFINCLAYKCGVGIVINNSNVAFAGVILGCTLVGNASDGIRAPALTGLAWIANNLITDNGGYGITGSTSPAALHNNRFRDNTSGAISIGADWATATSYGHVTTDAGGPETDYVDYANDDYRLVASSPAVGAGLPAPTSIGCFQRSAASGSGRLIGGGLII